MCQHTHFDVEAPRRRTPSCRQKKISVVGEISQKLSGDKFPVQVYEINKCGRNSFLQAEHFNYSVSYYPWQYKVQFKLLALVRQDTV